MVNSQPLDEFFGRETARMVVRQPLQVADLADKLDLKVTVRGGSRSLPPSSTWLSHFDCATMAFSMCFRSGWVFGFGNPNGMVLTLSLYKLVLKQLLTLHVY